jgi:hypothetical protein
MIEQTWILGSTKEARKEQHVFSSKGRLSLFAMHMRTQLDNRELQHHFGVN